MSDNFPADFSVSLYVTCSFGPLRRATYRAVFPTRLSDPNEPGGHCVRSTIWKKYIYLRNSGSD